MEDNTIATDPTPSTGFTNDLEDLFSAAADNSDDGKPSKYEISPWAYEYDVNTIYLAMMFIMSGKCAVYVCKIDLKGSPLGAFLH